MSVWTEDERSDAFVRAPEVDGVAALGHHKDRQTVLPAGTLQPATAYLHSFDHADMPLLAGLPSVTHEIVAARTTVCLGQAHIGAAVVVVFDRGDVRRPIVIGVLQELAAASPAPQVTARVDDQRLVLSAEREVVLQCGKASITLTRAGKVMIKGTYVLSRSSGPNRIKGAAVDIN